MAVETDPLVDIPLADGLAAAQGALLEAFEPDPDISIWEWADKHRVLTSKVANVTGPYRSAMTPFLRVPMYHLSPQSPVEKVVLMKGAQVGASEAAVNAIGYYSHLVPSSMMMVHPSVETAQRFSRVRIAPLYQDTPVLRHLLGGLKSRDGANSMMLKEFPGGQIMLAGSNAGAGLRSMIFGIGLFDEVDAWSVSAEEEGDPLELARRGMSTFEGRRKEMILSTPSIRNRSKIEREYLDTEQNRFYVPCPKCGHKQQLLWKDEHGNIRLTWKGKGDKRRVYMPCEECKFEIRNYHKPKMLLGGEWRATKPENYSREVWGGWISGLYSPAFGYSWERMVKDFLRVRKNPMLFKVWVNQRLAETWVDEGEAPDWETLYNRREDYPMSECPEGADVLVCGVDVQGDRVEYEVVGYGPGLRSWSIESRAIPGDPADPELWAKVAALLDREFPCADGNGYRRLSGMCVDSGYETQTVYGWVRNQHPGKVWAVKGYERQVTILSNPTAVDVTIGGRKITRGCKLWKIGVSVAKTELYGFLRQRRADTPGAPYPPGYSRFPQHSEEYFKQLCAERLVQVIDKRGFLKYEWQKMRQANEALDCRVYARAATAILGLDRWTDQEWESARDNRSSKIQTQPATRRTSGRKLDRSKWRGLRQT